jgi:hypothetical protein
MLLRVSPGGGDHLGHQPPDPSMSPPGRCVTARRTTTRRWEGTTTFLVPVEIRELVSGSYLGVGAQNIREPEVGMTLLEIHGSALLAPTVDPGEAATRQRGAEKELAPQRMIPAETRDRHRQFLPVEVLAVPAPMRLHAAFGAITGQGRIEFT